MKCLQCSVAIQRLLRGAGIESTLWAGAFCAAEVFEEPGLVGWGGFWGEDHHVWLATEYYEYVDLSISQLHLHPRRQRTDALPIPPVWWGDIAQWPCVLKYLPDSPAGLDFSPADHDDLASFLEKVDVAFEVALRKGDLRSVRFGDILHGPESMNALYDSGNPWVVQSLIVQSVSFSFPQWIQDRESELSEAYRKGIPAPSRLAK